MKVQTDKIQESQSSITSRFTSESSDGGTAQLKDNRTSTIDQRKLRSGIDSSDNTKTPIQRKNNTGLPDNLKAGIENLSGYSMDDVKVHYNSSKPAQLQAHAYAKGTDIHLASGQEKHLPHEAWHVVQQKQGRVKPTMQFKGKVNINDDVGLEKEADVMGEKAKGWTSYQSIYSKNMPLKSKQNTLKSIGAHAIQRRLSLKMNSQFKQTINANIARADIGRPNHGAIAQSASQLTFRDLLTMYNTALTYIRADPTGQNVLNIIENAQDNVIVRIGYDEPTEAHIPTQTQQNRTISIPWNPLMFFGVWSGNQLGFNAQVGTMSPAAVLLHEFGHVAQYILTNLGYYELWNNGSAINELHRHTFEIEHHRRPIEHHDMARFEIPFNIANNEPLRDNYSNALVSYDSNYNQAAVLPPGLQAEFDARIAYINNNGWVNAVTQHTNLVNPGANHVDLNPATYNSDNLNIATRNQNWIVSSTQRYFDNLINPHIQNTNLTLARGNFRSLIRILQDIYPVNLGPLPNPVKIALTAIVQPLLNWFVNNHHPTQGLDQDWNNL